MRMPFAPLEVNALGNSDGSDDGADGIATTEQIANSFCQFGVEDGFSSACFWFRDLHFNGGDWLALKSVLKTFIKTVPPVSPPQPRRPDLLP